jgi:hypothetical protein
MTIHGRELKQTSETSETSSLQPSCNSINRPFRALALILFEVEPKMNHVEQLPHGFGCCPEDARQTGNLQ